MTPNPTVRPFVWGAALFLVLAGFWPGSARGDRAPARARCALTVNKPKGNVIAYATTQYAEHFWGPRPLRCDPVATWDLAF